MSLKAVVLVAFCLTLFGATPSLAGEATKKHPRAFAFILHPRLTALGDSAVDIRIIKSTYLAESTSVTCTKDRAVARVVYLDHNGQKRTVVGQFVDMTQDGAQFEIKMLDFPGR
jgi:hypothetical protein